MLKSLASRLPATWQAELRRLRYARQISAGRFDTDEAEYSVVGEYLRPGDWAIDVGANIGQYTKRFSDLVGPRGRVLAFEPVPTTFALLAANVGRFPNPNVSLFNVALSDRADTVGMDIPRFDTGLVNYYEAHLTANAGAELTVLTLRLDALALQQPIALVKIDAEGHEESVLAGMQQLISSSRPVLIVETWSEPLVGRLRELGYAVSRREGSSNIVCVAPGRPARA